jgi:hypothetical protein
MQSPATYKACDLRNSGEAFRRFHPAGLLVGAHVLAIRLLRHKLAGAAIAGMGASGLVAALFTFWPK